MQPPMSDKSVVWTSDDGKFYITEHIPDTSLYPQHRLYRKRLFWFDEMYFWSGEKGAVESLKFVVTTLQGVLR